MMEDLASKLGYKQENSSSYYSQANEQVEAVNKSLNFILQQTIAQSKTNWHIMLYPSLWAYRTVVKTSTGFSPYQLVHGVYLTGWVRNPLIEASYRSFTRNFPIGGTFGPLRVA